MRWLGYVFAADVKVAREAAAWVCQWMIVFAKRHRKRSCLCIPVGKTDLASGVDVLQAEIEHSKCAEVADPRSIVQPDGRRSGCIHYLFGHTSLRHDLDAKARWRHCKSHRRGPLQPKNSANTRP